MKKFEIGKQYVIGHVEFYGDVTVEVTARTAKFATFKKFGKEKELRSRYGIIEKLPYGGI